MPDMRGDDLLNDYPELADDDDLPQSERAYRVLEQLIITMELEPNAMISEAMLSKRLGIGRTPVREALQRLASEHLVEIMPRRGIRVSPIDLKKQMRLLEVRRPLELTVAKLAARRAGDKARATLRDIGGSFRNEASKDYQVFLVIDRQFNEMITEAADNPYAIDMLQTLHGLSRRFWHYYHRHDEDLPRVCELHADIATAVADGDEKTVETTVNAHMDYIHDFTLSLLQD
jgi:DNA-binding GntR family transcriptional regulator